MRRGVSERMSDDSVTWRPDLRAAAWLRVIIPATGADRAPRHRIAGQPVLAPVARRVGSDEGGRVGNRIKAADRHGLVGGDKAEVGRGRRPSSPGQPEGRGSAARCVRQCRRRRDGCAPPRRDRFRAAAGRRRMSAGRDCRAAPHRQDPLAKPGRGGEFRAPAPRLSAARAISSCGTPVPSPAAE